MYTGWRWGHLLFVKYQRKHRRPRMSYKSARLHSLWRGLRTLGLSLMYEYKKFILGRDDLYTEDTLASALWRDKGDF